MIEFQYTLNELHIDKDNSKFKIIYAPKGRSSLIQNLTVRVTMRINQDHGQILIKNLNLLIEFHQTVLSTGISGSGKSTFLRTLANIWSHGSGTISFPIDDTMAFLPLKVRR